MLRHLYFVCSNQRHSGEKQHSPIDLTYQQVTEFRSGKWNNCLKIRGQTNKLSNDTLRFIYLNVKEKRMSENYCLRMGACDKSNSTVKFSREKESLKCSSPRFFTNTEETSHNSFTIFHFFCKGFSNIATKSNMTLHTAYLDLGLPPYTF